MRKAPWNDTENQALNSLYHRMHQGVQRTENLNKAALIRIAQGQAKDTDRATSTDGFAGLLAERSRGSIEAKLMNLTAVLHDLGRAQFSMSEHGYRPLSNYQADLKQAAVDYLNDVVGIETAA